MLRNYSVEAMHNTVEEYSNLVYRLCLVYLKNHFDAEDAYQEVFIKVIEKAPLFTDENHKKAWLIRVTSNHCKSILRNKKNKNETALEKDEISYADKKNDNELLQYIFTLPLNYRKVLYLYYYEGYSTKEISVILKTRDATVRTWLKRARESLKKVMGGGVL